MKKVVALLIVCQLINFSSCSYNQNSNQSIFVEEIKYSKQWMYDKIDIVGLKNWKIQNSVEGVFDLNTKTKQTAFLFCNYTNDEKAIYHSVCLAVEVGESVYFKDLKTTNFVGSYSDSLSVADLDGDGDDEIVINSCVGMSGGAGQYVSRVFETTNDGIFEIFYSADYTNRFDTGFTSEIRPDYKIIIKNVYTGYERELDYSKNQKYLDVFFDAGGNVIRESLIACDSFNSFVPTDVNKDNIKELLCLQYVSLNGHSDFIGTAKTILKFNNEENVFEVYDATFLPYE